MTDTAPTFDDHEQGPEQCPDLSICPDQPEQPNLDVSLLFSAPVVPEGDSQANYFYDDLSTEVRQEFQRAFLSNVADRPSLLEQEKPAALHFIFIKLGMSPISDDEAKNQKSTAKFMKAYNQADQRAAAMDADMLGELYDSYEQHPVMRVLQRVSDRTDNLRTTVVQMRKTSLVMLDENPVPQPS